MPLDLLGTFRDSVPNLLLHLGTNRPVRSFAERHQLLFAASASQNSKKTFNSLTNNANANLGKNHNNTNITFYPHSELKEELSRTHYSIY